jgi:hypothetical protein
VPFGAPNGSSVSRTGLAFGDSLARVVGGHSSRENLSGTDPGSTAFFGFVREANAMPEPDIWGTTRKLIEIYGANAVTTAMSRAQRLIAEGDKRGSVRWQQIGTAARQLLDRRMTG